MKAAATPRPSAMPPAAMTGRVVASQIWGTKTMVVSSPTWPPLSPPSAMRAEAPRRVISLAMATEATTGITRMPASFHRAMYLVGLPAPVVTTATFSSATTWATSSTKGLISMMFTPKGRLVRDLATWICSRTASPGALPAAMMPRPPPSDTAAASLPSAIQAMPPWNTGYSMPSRSHNGVRIMPACSQ